MLTSVVTTQLKQDDIFFMNVQDLTSTGIKEETLSPISCFISNSTQVLFHLNNYFSLVLLIVTLYWFDFLLFWLFILSLSFYLFFFLIFILSFFFPYCSSLNIYSYEVAITVCPCAPCNKLLILKIKKKKNRW